MQDISINVQHTNINDNRKVRSAEEERRSLSWIMRCLLQVEHFGVFLAVHFPYREGWDSIRLYIANIIFFSLFSLVLMLLDITKFSPPPIDVFLTTLKRKCHIDLFHSLHSLRMCESIEVLNTSCLLV